MIWFWFIMVGLSSRVRKDRCKSCAFHIKKWWVFSVLYLLLKAKKRNEHFKLREIEMNELIEWIKEATKVKWGQYAIAYYSVYFVHIFVQPNGKQQVDDIIFSIYSHICYSGLVLGFVCVHLFVGKLKKKDLCFFCSIPIN